MLRVILLICYIMYFEIKLKVCIVGVSFVNLVKEWYLVYLMLVCGEWYFDLFIYRIGFVDCFFFLWMWSFMKSENFFLDVFDKLYLKYYEI